MVLPTLQTPGSGLRSKYLHPGSWSAWSSDRACSALSPTPPFPKQTYRLRIASTVIPILGISLFVTSYMYMKGVMFGVGFAFFGDPILSRGLDLLNRTFPNWQKMLELRK